MKKFFKVIFIVIIVFSGFSVYAESDEISDDDILNSQEKELGISDFIKISKEYTKNNLDEIDIQDIFKSAITGRVENINLFNNILNIFGKEFKSTISSIRHCICNNCNT